MAAVDLHFFSAFIAVQACHWHVVADDLDTTFAYDDGAIFFICSTNYNIADKKVKRWGGGGGCNLRPRGLFIFFFFDIW